MPQDVRLSADGQIFYVADMAAGGIWLISMRQFRPVRFIRTGAKTGDATFTNVRVLATDQ